MLGKPGKPYVAPLHCLRAATRRARRFGAATVVPYCCVYGHECLYLFGRLFVLIPWAINCPIVDIPPHSLQRRSLRHIAAELRNDSQTSYCLHAMMAVEHSTAAESVTAFSSLSVARGAFSVATACMLGCHHRQRVSLNRVA